MQILSDLNRATCSWTRWWFHIFFIFTPTWGNDPIWLAHIFQMGGEKPPTRWTMYLSLVSKLLSMWWASRSIEGKKQVGTNSLHNFVARLDHSSVILLLTHLTFQFQIPNSHSLPKTNSSTLKLVGILVSFWDGPFAGANCFEECTSKFHPAFNLFCLKLNLFAIYI